MDLSSPRLGEIDALFAELLDASDARREEALAAVAGGDPELAATVARLLEVSGEDEGPLDELGGRLRRAAVELLSGDPEDAEADPVVDGEIVDRYRVLERIARGGWGTVYHAERADGAFRRRVALKVLRRGLDTEDVLARFHAERQILASLEHPNIARLVDAGATADGRPFLALEYVEGRRIDEHCERADLSRQERLELFVMVARAVHHAHRHLVVHRDLKPSNILVTAEGEVKLLDFGIAKILDPSMVPVDTPVTRTGRLLLTPDYASPEQLRGEPPTTASDIYQLGLVLRRLLDEERAPGTAGDHRSGPEAAPGTRRARRAIPSDLGTILRTSLHEEPERRYASAERMADDVERYLAGRPISARPDTTGYRIRRFLGRHRWVAPTAALVALLAVAWMVTLQRQRDIARAEAERAREAQRLLVDLFRSPDPFAEAGGPGRDVTVREALTRGADRLRDELQDLPALRAELLGTVSEVLENLGSVHEALAVREEVLAVEREAYGERSLPVAASLGRLGYLLIDVQQEDSAEAVLQRQVEITTELAGPLDPRVGVAVFNLGRAHTAQGEFDRAREDFERAAEILRPAEPPRPEELVEVLQFLAQSYFLASEVERAVETGGEAVARAERFWGPEHPATARARTYFGAALRHAGRFEEAERELRRSAGTLEAQLGSAHPFTLSSLVAVGEFLLTHGDAEEAARFYARRVEGTLQLYGEESEPVAYALNAHANSLRHTGRTDEAASVYRRAIATYEKLPGPSTGLAISIAGLARMYVEHGRFAEAVPVARESLSIIPTAWRHTGESTVNYRLGEAECVLGRALVGHGREGEARTYLERGIARFEELGTDPMPVPQCVRTLEAIR